MFMASVPGIGSRKPWVACIEAKAGCQASLDKLYNVCEVQVDDEVKTVKAPKKLLWGMIDADIEFRQSGKMHSYGNLCFRLEFLGSQCH